MSPAYWAIRTGAAASLNVHGVGTLAEFSRRGSGTQHTAGTARGEAPTPAERRAAMTWAQRLKRALLRASCPARPAARRCASSRASRIRRSSRSSSPTWIRKPLNHQDGPRPAGRRRSTACSINRDDSATTLRRLRRRWCGDDIGWAGGRGAGEKCADEPVAAVNAGAVMPLRGDNCAAANAARRCRHRPGAGISQREVAL